jgi:hypothetical protein
MISWRLWLLISGVLLCLSGVAGLLLHQALAQAPPAAPCDEVLLTLHRQLADQVQAQLLQELAAARRALAARQAPPAPAAPKP